jgi:DNA-binding response OmpR family regulator
MLPGIDGLDVCRILRRESAVPIIMLTARAEEADRLIGLELGADDYVVKPFSPREVVLRVRAILRRVEGEVVASELLQAGDIALDLAAHQATVAGRPVELTPMEFELLAVLARSPGRTFGRAQLLQQIQDSPLEGFDRTIDVHVRNIRAKIEPDPKNPRYVLTVYGVGYKLAEVADAA